MFRRTLAQFALISLGCALPAGAVAAQDQQALILQSVEIKELAFEAGFKGEIAIDMGNMAISAHVSPDLEREGYVPFVSESPLWPFASVTKQILAARLLGELNREGISLDTPISRYVPQISRRGGRVPTFRELLQHRSGLRNPEDTPMEANGWPAFYNKPGDYGLEWCLNGRSEPPASGWTYNNCDYIVLGAAFEELSFESVDNMLAGPPDAEIGERPGGRNSLERVFITPDNVERFYAIRSPERDILPSYGASGSLGGTLQDIVYFNWGLMHQYGERGDAMAEMWKGDPALGNMALGQWVFETQPPGCPSPVIVAERKGQIGQYRMHNILLPQLKRSMVFATIDPDFEFGEIWAGEGFLPEAVAKLACGAGE